jgi:Uncharacterized protein conserved in bacteria
MIERVEISLLLDTYSVLLTEKQNEIMTMYYNDDFSLAEISEITNTSRQAIHDLIKRCHKLLVEYENKLSILSTNMRLEKLKVSLLKDITDLTIINKDQNSIEIIEKMKENIINNL